MILLSHHNNLIQLNIQFQIYNTSKSKFDLEKLKLTIISQLTRVFNSSIGGYQINVKLAGSICYKNIQLSKNKILLQIVDTVNGNNPAEADLGGLRIRLNQKIINDIILGNNVRTIPHEFGHLFGWNHPHANATFESINPNADELEKQLTEQERCCNLMSQTWYIQKAKILPEKGMCLTKNQIELLINNFNNKLLNKNYHLKHFLFWKHLY